MLGRKPSRLISWGLVYSATPPFSRKGNHFTPIAAQVLAGALHPGHAGSGHPTLGGDLASQWRFTAERIGLVKADLHAKSKADYSADPLGAIIPPISPAILKDCSADFSTWRHAPTHQVETRIAGGPKCRVSNCGDSTPHSYTDLPSPR